MMIAAAGCAAQQGPKEGTMQKKSADERVDSQRASKVAVVLRVRLIEHEGGNKYEWDTVHLVSVIKNDSPHKFPEQFRVAHDNGEAGIPEGESTVYLERFNATDESLWKLLGGSAATGVSHPN